MSNEQAGTEPEADGSSGAGPYRPAQAAGRTDRRRGGALGLPHATATDLATQQQSGGSTAGDVERAGWRAGGFRIEFATKTGLDAGEIGTMESTSFPRNKPMKTAAEQPSAADASLENDPTFRQEVVDGVFEEAEKRGLPIDSRSRRLLNQYAKGSISYPELDREVVRLVMH